MIRPRPLALLLGLLLPGGAAWGQERPEWEPYAFEGLTLERPARWELTVLPEVEGSRGVALVERTAAVEVQLTVVTQDPSPEDRELLASRPRLVACRAAMEIAPEALLFTFNDVALGDGPAPAALVVTKSPTGHLVHLHSFVAEAASGHLVGTVILPDPPGPGPAELPYHRAVGEAYRILRTLRTGRQPAAGEALGGLRTLPGYRLRLPAGWELTDHGKHGVLLKKGEYVRVIVSFAGDLALDPRDAEVWRQQPGIVAFGFVAGLTRSVPEEAPRILSFNELQVGDGRGAGAQVTVLVGDVAVNHHGFARVDLEGRRRLVGAVLWRTRANGAPADDPALQAVLGEAYAVLRSLRFGDDGD